MAIKLHTLIFRGPTPRRLVVLVVALALLVLILPLTRLPHHLSSPIPSSHALLDHHDRSAGERLILQRPESPSWCSLLAARPLPFANTESCIGFARLSDSANAGCARFFSQYQQDIWLWLAIARFMPNPGVYVDVGANNPALISNTYFFDRCLGWQGVCVEAQTKYHQALMEHRSCTLAACVSDREADLTFVQADDLGGIETVNKNVNGTRDWQGKAHTAERSTVHCVPLKHVLEKHRITEVTYMSLDVEGAELLVLNGIDWHATHIAFITMEGGDGNPARKLLLDKGYTLVRSGSDGFFASRKALQMVENLKGKGYLHNLAVPE